MGRPRKYETQADRQRAYEERKARESDTTPSDPALVAAPAEPAETPSAASTAEPQPDRGVEEAYVAAQLEQMKAYMASFRSAEKTTPEAQAARLERAEAYARWRFRAFHAGEVFSL